MSNKKLVFEKPELTVEELSSALYNANQKLDLLNKQLIEQEKERSVFYANISHDLRSPMAAINGSLEYLLSQDQFDTEELRATLRMMYNRSLFLNQMINDIFTLSSLTSSNKHLRKETLDMGFFLEEFFYECAEDKKYYGRILRMKVPMDLECMCEIDPTLIKRVLDNLFTNALKYSDTGASITLSAKVEEAFLRVSVSDTGIGIAEDQLEKIFDRSYRIDTARTQGAKASCGFGLAIAKSIIEKHEGRIWCESKPDVGSEFIFLLPICKES